jgi:hypothetical protein
MDFNYGTKQVTCGKYAGKTLSFIKKHDISELTHIAMNYPDAEIRAAADILVKGSLKMLNYVAYGRELDAVTSITSNDMIDTVYFYWADRGQPNKTKLSNDIQDGKLGEWIAFNTLSSIYGFGKISQPDHNIYSSENKRWHPDLINKDTGQEFYVVTQTLTRAKNFTKSWVFSIEDPLYLQKTSTNAKVCFVELDTAGKCGRVLAIINIGTLHNIDAFKEPLKLELIKTKRVVKWKDIENIDKCEL